MDVGLFVYTKIGLWKISINPKNYRTLFLVLNTEHSRFIVRISHAYIVFSVFEICKIYENTHIYIVMGCNFRVCLVRL